MWMLTEKEENFLPAGAQIAGHEFHYYDSTDNGVGAVPKAGKRKIVEAFMRVRRNGWDSRIYILLQSGIRVPFPEKGGGQNLLEK